jgi:hypothetical protein
MATFMGRRLSEIDGFVALDQNSRYEIRFGKPPKKEKPFGSGAVE